MPWNSIVGSTHLLGTVNKTATSNHVPLSLQVPAFSSLERMPRIGITESCRISLFSLLRLIETHCSDFYSDRISLGSSAWLGAPYVDKVSLKLWNSRDPFLSALQVLALKLCAFLGQDLDAASSSC